MYRWGKYGAVFILLLSMFDGENSLAQERGIYLSNQPAKTSESRVALVIGNFQVPLFPPS